jgi:WD40 repeat protein
MYKGVKICNVDTGKVVTWLPTYSRGKERGVLLDMVNSVSFSPDGKSIASGGNDGRIQIWVVGNNPIGATVNATVVPKLKF